MAKNNGTHSSRSSNPDISGRERQRSQSQRKGSGTSSRSDRARSSSSRSSSEKSNPDALSTVSRGFQEGRRRGRGALESVQSAGSRVVESVTEHPVPVALIGAGLAWLLLESRGIRPTDARIVQRSREAVGGVGHTIADAAGTAGQAIAGAVSTAAESIAEGASYVGEYVSDAASVVGETTSSGYEYGRETLGNMWDEHPLMMSAGILAAGIAAGMLLPGTLRERTLLGDAAENVAEKVRTKGAELVEQGKRLASSGVKAMRREGERQGITAQEIGQKVKRIARSGRKAVAE
jgi:hypothetical protein